MEVESVVGANANSNALLDDDGKARRTGTVWSASAHIITAVIGAGVLSLAWAMAQLGWILGTTSILIFAGVTLYTSNLLADCYRSPHPVTGKRNHTYMEAVKAHLGGRMHMICGLIQYSNLVGIAIGYTITTSISVVTIVKNNCMKKHNGSEADCHFSNNPSIIGIAIAEIFLSQIPNFHKLSWISFLAAIMSFGYAFIGIGLSLTIIIQGKGKSTSLFMGKTGQSSSENIWNMLVALGNIALANSYAQISIDIQDSLKSTPAENKVMKMANSIGIITMSIIFLLSGGAGYAAFGEDTPGSILNTTGNEHVWLVYMGNVFIIIHILGAYQVLIQPFYHIVELLVSQRWPSSNFINKEYFVGIGKIQFSINLFRLIWRTIFVVVASVLAMAMPFFNDMLALLGAIGFWPLAVYFPIQMIIVKRNIRKGTMPWIGLQSLSLVCMIVSIAAACAAIHGLGQALGKYKPFMYKA
ncbi:amino acid permease 8 [Arachis duranensis]|uniref:Amino acid permease 8 n=1 Tax=Arachis duranensis TaxID=130453 RepID=A0A6P4BB04_ARADU|nr:amino acid permease 8 [Arachis duranensis]